MLDVSLFRVPAFVGVQLSTFCIGAGMFALFPFLSIYLQDILGFSPLKAGLRIPAVHRLRVPRPARDAQLRADEADVAAARRRDGHRRASGSCCSRSSRRPPATPRCCPASSSPGIGTGLANPTIAGAALRVVDPARTGMAAGISNTARHHAASRSASPCSARSCRAGSARACAAPASTARRCRQAVSSAGVRAAHGEAALAHAVPTAFVSGLDTIVLIGAVVLAIGRAGGGAPGAPGGCAAAGRRSRAGDRSSLSAVPQGLPLVFRRRVVTAL